MTSGSRMAIKLIMSFLTALSLLFLNAQSMAAIAANDDNLNKLMASLAEKSMSKASFIERKSSSLLRQDLQFEGELIYRRPDYMMKKTNVPRFELIEINEGKLLYKREGQPDRELALNNYPLLAAFVSAFTAVLSGDITKLQNYYKINFSERDYGWRLSLSPLLKKMQETIESIVIMGESDRIYNITITEAGGDKSMMTLRHKIQ